MDGRRRSPSWAVLVALLAPCVASGQVAPDASAPAPIHVRLVGGDVRPEYRHPPAGATFAPPNPASSADVGAHAVEAYRGAAARAFPRAAGRATEALEVGVALVEVEVTLEPDGWTAVVEHDVALAAGGRELGRWRVRGEWPVEGPGPGAIPRALARAGNVAAARWETELPGASGVAEWLAARGMPPPPARTAPEVPSRAAALARIAAPRAPHVFHFDAGLAVYRLRGEALRARVGEGEIGVTLRGGVSTRVVTANVVLAQLNGPGRHVALGVDAGAVLRLAPIELRGGGGVYAGTGSAIAPSAFVGIQYTVSAARDRRARVGAELRHWVGTGRPDDPPGETVAVTIGFEGPLRSASQPR